MHIPDSEISFILPCLNEHEPAKSIVRRLREAFPCSEIILVDDGSTPAVSIDRALEVTVLRHPYSIGNGGAIKTGVRKASGYFLVFMDADGQHDPEDAQALLERLEQGFDMAVAARSIDNHASLARRYANNLFNKLASLMTGFHIKDLTSGFRAARAKPFRNFLYLLPNGFSYPTTSTMAFFRCGYSVDYVPIAVSKRQGASKLRMFREGVRFFDTAHRSPLLADAAVCAGRPNLSCWELPDLGQAPGVGWATTNTPWTFWTGLTSKRSSSITWNLKCAA